MKIEMFLKHALMVDNADYWEYSIKYVFSIKLHNNMVCILS